MEITFLGTGVAIPQKDRVQSGLLADIHGKPLLIDCGSGVLNRIQECGIKHTEIDTLVLSHLHLDHVADVLCLLKANWLCGKTDARIYGPKGTEEWFKKLLGLYEYMLDKFEVEVIEVEPGQEFFPEGFDCGISTEAGVHSVPSLAFRVDSDTGAFVYSGDTEPCRSIMDLSVGADLLIHECSYPLGTEVTNHTTPEGLADLIEEYGEDFGKLCLTHFYPEMQGKEKQAIACLKDCFEGEVIAASDLLKLKI